MLLTLLNLVLGKEYAPTYWSKGKISSLLMKGNREALVIIYRGITLLFVISKLYNKVINIHLLKYLELEHKLLEEQGLSDLGRFCIENIFS